MKTLKTATLTWVTIDDAHKFLAWIFDEDWNGWAVPYFEKSEAEKVAKVHGGKFYADSFMFQQGDEIEVFEEAEIMTPEGKKKVYAVGAGSWVWDEVEWSEN